MTSINTNIKAHHAQLALAHNERHLTHAVAQLATGQRVNNASDDAAGVGISTGMAAQVRSLNMAVRNANDGVSMLQTADAAAQGLVDILHRMKEISVQYLNGTNESSDRTAIDAEFSQLTSAIGSIVDNTTWNGMPVLRLASPTKDFQVGAASGDIVSASFTDFSDAGNPVKIAQSLTSVTDSTTLTKLDNALNEISSERAGWGAVINRLQYAGDNSATTAVNLAASRSRIVDTDYAQATADLARAQIVQQAGSAMLAQANQSPYLVLALLT